MSKISRRVQLGSKILIGLLLVAVIMGAGWVYWQKSAKAKPLGRTVTVKRGTVRSIVQATGSVAAVDSVDIGAKITGRIVDVRVQENDRVHVGQVLAVLDDSHYRALVEQADARREVSRKNYERLKLLAVAGGIARKELDAARMEWEVAAAEYEMSAAQLTDTVIRSPIDGIVVGKPIPAGQTVSSGLSTPMVLMTVADLARLELQVLVDEADVGKIRIGQKIGFTVDAYPRKMFMGEILSISSKATLQQNVVYYPVTISPQGQQADLKPNMTVRVTVVAAQKKNVLNVPAVAIANRGRQAFVRVPDGDEIREVDIQKGLIGTERVEVAAGLQEGDKVLLPPGAKGGMSGMSMGLPGGGHHH